jgi:hypothetical protein
MEEPEARTHSFIVKVWLEETPAETGRGATWRGHVTHVQSGTRRYFDQLSFIADFVAPYLESMGVRLGRAHSLIRRLRGRRSDRR